MRKHKFKIEVNGKTAFQKEGETLDVYGEARGKMMNELSKALGGWQKLKTETPGQGGSVNITVSWENTFNKRAPARPKDVIASEKAAKAAEAQAQAEKFAEAQASWEKDVEVRVTNTRNRIKSQIDHAFALGKHGTEPASTFITCMHCDAPAAVVCLNQPLTPGAAVLDEDTIVGALCAQHIKHAVYGYGYYRRLSRYTDSNVTKVKCSKLEFFYDGVRSIAVKP